MNKKWIVTGTLLAATLMFASYHLFQNKEKSLNGERYQSALVSPETMLKGEDKQKEEFSFSDKIFQNDEKKCQINEEKIELTDYVDLSVEEFIEETGILLYQEEAGTWRTENETVWLNVDDGKIISLQLYKSIDDESDAEEYLYTIAGICLNDEVENIESTILKNASKVSGEGYGYDYYTSLELSGLGIERMELIHLETVDGICVYFDMSLKENTENLEYIRSEKLYQAQKDKMMLEIKYPHFEIPGYSQMTQNINDLIIGAVEELEARINEDTDEDVIVNADYKITYMTSKFISITFRARVTDYASEKKVYQYCNIDITKNGEKAYLVNMGIRKEQILEACESWAAVPVDVETYINDYDTNWDQYYIAPEKYVFIVRVLNEDDCYYGVEWYK